MRPGSDADLDTWLSYIGGVHPVGWDLGLDRVREVGQTLALEHPGSTTLLIAGTNGKGSTCEYLEKLALGAGLSVGKSTSPHLHRFNERICLNGHPASDAEIVRAFQRIDQARGETTLTYFEFASLASMLIFRQQQVDVAILEIGLGGRFDAMNIVDADLSIITAIDLDHQAYLGDTREAIGFEKAGVMRTGKPCLLADRDPPLSIAAHAASIGSVLSRIGSDFDLDLPVSTQLPRDSFVVALEAARRLHWNLGQVETVARQTTLPGRRTWIRGKPTFLLDVAHNPAAAASLAEYLETLTEYPEVHGVLGMYADKDIEQVTALLAPLIKTWHLTSMDEQRAATSVEIRARLSVDTAVTVMTYDKIGAAVEGAVNVAEDHDLVLVFGSFPLVAAGLQLLS